MSLDIKRHGRMKSVLQTGLDRGVAAYSWMGWIEPEPHVVKPLKRHGFLSVVFITCGILLTLSQATLQKNSQHSREKSSVAKTFEIKLNY